MGSTIPLMQPSRKELHLELPSARMGMEMMAPSGTFCMAMPSDTATADASEMPAMPCSAPANTTPTAMPSGRLCMVTASANIAVRESLLRGPSGVLVPMWRWGVSSSMNSRNAIPNRKPTAAGATAHGPALASMSIAGISSDHTEAATITPEAKPNNVFCRRGDISSFMKNTKAEPSMVPSRGMNSPTVSGVIVVCKILVYRLMPAALTAAA